MAKARTINNLASYIRIAGDCMGLRDWRFDVGEGTAEGNSAECTVIKNQRRARICFTREWVDPEVLTNDEIRYYVAHELMHCHMWFLDDFVEHLSNAIGQPARDLTMNMYNDRMEQVVDPIAFAWAETLPLPDFR
jgi:hypothetical protein